MQTESPKTIDKVVFLGETGFPIGLAAIQRMTLMAKAMVFEGCKVTVICRKGVWKKDEQVPFKNQGVFEGIYYVITSKSVFKPEGFFKRNLDKLRGIYGEFMYLKHLKKHEEIDVAIISNMKVFHILRYRIYSAYLNIPIVLNLVEMASSMQDRTGFFTRINDYLMDNWIIKLFHGSLPISDKLANYYAVIAPSKPSLKLPILCDYDKFNIVKKDKEESYFLYCGSAAYMEVIYFIIKSYKSIANNENTKLYMIISGGNKNSIKLLEQEIDSIFDDKPIKLFSNIPYIQLVHLYSNALALLIPLRPTVQDTSRFPHKIGEYLASGNPVVTTNVGEIKNYFEDGKTALIADTYSHSQFAEKMQFVLDNPELSKKIGMSGKKLGLKEFDYKIHGRRIKKFLQELS